MSAWEHRCEVCGQTVTDHSGLCAELAGAEWHNHCCRGCPCLSWREAHVRVQRRRTKGWRMPEGAVYVGRPSALGNPFVSRRVGGRWLVVATGMDDLIYTPAHNTKQSANELAVILFRSDFLDWFGGRVNWEPGLRSAVEGLRGKQLACWCPTDGGPCHADVLWEIANGERIPKLVIP